MEAAINEPQQHDKISEDSEEPGYPPILTRAFTWVQREDKDQSFLRVDSEYSKYIVYMTPG